MKRVLIFLVVLMLLASGCSFENHELDRMMSFRASLLSGIGCSFLTNITADYQQELYQFVMDCRSDEQGSLHFTVCEPESISGISGEIADDKGKLTFHNDTVLAFETLTDDQITPVAAPWILVKTLRGGYVTSCCKEENLLRVSIDDSYRDDALHVDIWFDAENNPFRAEILWKDRRILTLEVTNFVIL